MVFFLILGLFLTPLVFKHTEVDSDLQKYYNDWLTLVSHHCEKDQLFIPISTKVGFTSSLNKRDWLAVCIMSGSHWEIKVHKNKWLFLNEAERVGVMYHEFSHCLLRLDHVDNPKNYMYYANRMLPLEVLELQVLEDAWKVCGKK